MQLRACVIYNKCLPKQVSSVVFSHRGNGPLKNTVCSRLSRISAELLFSAESPPYPPSPFAATWGQVVVAGISQALYYLLSCAVCSLSLQPCFHKWGGERARDPFCAVSYYMVSLRSGVPSPELSRYRALCFTRWRMHQKATVQDQRAAFNPILEHNTTEFHSSINLMENESAPDHQALLWHQVLCSVTSATAQVELTVMGSFMGLCSPHVEAWSPILVVKCQE